MKHYHLGCIVVLAVALLLTGCSPQKEAWQQALRKNTVKAYQQYIRQFPEGAHVTDARRQMSRLSQARNIYWASDEWRQALKLDTADAYQRFERNYPRSQFAANAAQRLKQIHTEKHWARVNDSANKDALQQFVTDYPDSPQASEARDQLAALKKQPDRRQGPSQSRNTPPPGQTYQVQFAAVSSRQRAVAVARDVQKKMATVLDDTPARVESPPPGGTLYRVKTTSMSGAAAHRLCGAIKHQGVDCFVVERQR